MPWLFSCACPPAMGHFEYPFQNRNLMIYEAVSNLIRLDHDKISED
jgi:hypothetical protein